jgi:hypothetical protein
MDRSPNPFLPKSPTTKILFFLRYCNNPAEISPATFIQSSSRPTQHTLNQKLARPIPTQTLKQPKPKNQPRPQPKTWTRHQQKTHPDKNKKASKIQRSHGCYCTRNCTCKFLELSAKFGFMTLSFMDIHSMLA